MAENTGTVLLALVVIILACIAIFHAIPCLVIETMVCVAPSGIIAVARHPSI